VNDSSVHIARSSDQTAPDPAGVRPLQSESTELSLQSEADQPPSRWSRWWNWSQFSKPKRIPLPRTDLDSDDGFGADPGDEPDIAGEF
jgi:hypothetical protein